MGIRINIQGRIKNEIRRINKKPLIAGAISAVLFGFLSVFLTYMLGGSTLIYHQLKLPSWAPPKFIFSVVWTVIYALIGAATGAVAASRCSNEVDKYKGLLLFVLMMSFNFIWFPLFFAAYAFVLALFDLVAMGALTLYAIYYYRKIYVFSAFAMGIYFVWQCYSFLLNLYIVILN